VELEGRGGIKRKRDLREDCGNLAKKTTTMAIRCRFAAPIKETERHRPVTRADISSGEPKQKNSDKRKRRKNSKDTEADHGTQGHASEKRSVG